MFERSQTLVFEKSFVLYFQIVKKMYFCFFQRLISGMGYNTLGNQLERFSGIQTAFIESIVLVGSFSKA